jgi:hypothetical protein
MKTNIFKITTLLLALTGWLSCQTSDEIIEPILPDNDVIVFFEKYLSEFSGISESECFFVDEKYDNKLLIINSVDELRKNIFCSSAILPKIDFNSHSLIVGQYQMGGSGYSVDTQNIVIDSKKMTLNISVKCSESSFAVMCPLYYWGIYPKIQDKSIKINVKFIKGGFCL